MNKYCINRHPCARLVFSGVVKYALSRTGSRLKNFQMTGKCKCGRYYRDINFDRP